MVWGGSLDRDGSDYIKRLKEAENVIKFLEKLKIEVSYDESKTIANVIDIITNFLSEYNRIKTD